jgi:N-acetylglucosaminyldiphosphoundecaprenol N-acetyl-beta-D-mannosaminyltransferase
MKVTGVQWMHRIYQDPKRLWKRYLVNNPKFVYRIVLELLGISKQHEAEEAAGVTGD